MISVRKVTKRPKTLEKVAQKSAKGGAKVSKRWRQSQQKVANSRGNSWFYLVALGCALWPSPIAYRSTSRLAA